MKKLNAEISWGKESGVYHVTIRCGELFSSGFGETLDAVAANLFREHECLDRMFRSVQLRAAFAAGRNTEVTFEDWMSTVDG